jgi:small conductance mechanosensitive channel
MNINIKKIFKNKSSFELVWGVGIGIIILVVGHILGKVLEKVIYHVGQKNMAKLSKSAANDKQEEKTDIILVIVSKLAYYVIMIFAILTVFRRLGVETASIIAVVGTVGIGIGLALQGTFTDMASGILLAFNRTYKIGEIIKVQDNEGVVIDFNLLNTTLRGGDGSTITIPNRKITDSIVVNQTRQRERVIAFDILISNTNADFSRINDIIIEALNGFPGVVAEKDPIIGIASLQTGGSIVKIKVAIETKEYPKITLTLLAHIRDALLKNGVVLLDPEGSPTSGRMSIPS